MTITPHFNLSFFNKLRLGPGVVGRTAQVTVVLLVALVAAIFLIREIETLQWLIGWLVFAMILLPVAALGACFWYADKYPAAAVAEGAEALRWHQTDMAAKGYEQGLPDEHMKVVPPPKEIGQAGGDRE